MFSSLSRDTLNHKLPSLSLVSFVNLKVWSELFEDLFTNLIFFFVANVQPNLTIVCMVHATQLQNVHRRVGQQTETVQQDLELAVLLRKFSQHCYLSK